MGSIITRAKRLRVYRLSAQAAAFVLLNLRFLNIWFPNLALSGMLGVCAPGFYCHGCPWATMACPLGVIVTSLRTGAGPVLVVALASIGLVGTFGGRLVCGWICPFGWLQDLLYKLRTRKFGLPSRLRYVKYAVLAAFVFAGPYFLPNTRLSVCDACPSAFIESVIPYGFQIHWDREIPGILDGRFFLKAGVTLAVLLMSIVISRGFCRMLCPLGAMFGFFNRFSVFRYGLTHHKCAGCGACAKNCPVDIDPIKQMNDAECIKCYECTTTRHIKMGVK